MSTCKIQIDERPFRSRDGQARETALQSQYRRLAIPAVVAALQIECRTTASKVSSP